MEREPQLEDRVRTPTVEADGPVVARSQTQNGWYIAVRLEDTSLWKGLAREVDWVKAAGENALLEGSDGTPSNLDPPIST